MDLSPVKREILEALLLHEDPVKAMQIAKETGKKGPVVQMHLIGLNKNGYAESPQKGQYNISQNGKQALGLPQITKEKATEILAQTSPEKAFHFYTAVGKPLNLSANSLYEFSEKIEAVTLDSVEFHMNRGDFEAWFTWLGDLELAKKTALLSCRKLKAEEFREKIREITTNRCVVLLTFVGHEASSV